MKGAAAPFFPQPAPTCGMTRSAPAPATRARIGLALAGGGPLGAIYEIGACARWTRRCRAWT
jgi:hypothetical protein